MVDFKLIGLRIKERRFEKQITQAYLAEQAELSPQYLSQVEAGKKHISLDALVKVAKALHTTADDLLTGRVLVFVKCFCSGARNARCFPCRIS